MNYLERFLLKNDVRKNEASKGDIHDILSYTTPNLGVYATKCREYKHYGKEC